MNAPREPGRLAGRQRLDAERGKALGQGEREPGEPRSLGEEEKTRRAHAQHRTARIPVRSKSRSSTAASEALRASAPARSVAPQSSQGLRTSSFMVGRPDPSG